MAEPFPLLSLEGDAATRGRAYGRAAGERIAKGLELYRHDFARRGLEWGRALDAAARYAPALEGFDADLAEEIRAIADGAEQPVEAIVLLNARTELTLAATAAGETEGCTAGLALPETTEHGHTLHGQNWDWRPGCVETAVVLHLNGPDGHQALIFCEAGQLARHGMNTAGVALTANGLQTPDDLAPDGVPTPIVRRNMLMQTSLAGAAGVLLTSPRSCSHALIVSQCDGEAFCFEATPSTVFWMVPEGDLLSHANHFKDPVARAQVRDVGFARHPETLYRDRRMMAALEAERGRISKDTFARALADRYGSPDAICRSPAPRAGGAESATVASLIMDTTAGRMWIAPAPFETARYTEYRFD